MTETPNALVRLNALALALEDLQERQGRSKARFLAQQEAFRRLQGAAARCAANRVRFFCDRERRQRLFAQTFGQFLVAWSDENESAPADGRAWLSQARPGPLRGVPETLQAPVGQGWRFTERAMREGEQSARGGGANGKQTSSQSPHRG